MCSDFQLPPVSNALVHFDLMNYNHTESHPVSAFSVTTCFCISQLVYSFPKASFSTIKLHPGKFLPRSCAVSWCAVVVLQCHYIQLMGHDTAYGAKPLQLQYFWADRQITLPHWVSVSKRGNHKVNYTHLWNYQRESPIKVVLKLSKHYDIQQILHYSFMFPGQILKKAHQRLFLFHLCFWTNNLKGRS